MLEFVTFLLAPIGYAGLTATAVMAVSGRWLVRLWRLTVFIVVAHVTLVWHVRYAWQWSEATRNGFGGFIIFHAALVAVVASLAVERRTARWLLLAAQAAVTVGAIVATFKYDVVAIYRLPVLLIAAGGLTRLAHDWRRARRTRLAT